MAKQLSIKASKIHKHTQIWNEQKSSNITLQTQMIMDLEVELLKESQSMHVFSVNVCTPECS